MADMADRLRFLRLLGALMVSLGLASCADTMESINENLPSLPSMPKLTDFSWFKQKEEHLAGKRVPIVAAMDKSPGELASAEQPVSVPAPRQNEAWASPGGEPSNAPGNVALNRAVKEAWSITIGKGSNLHGRLTSSPIVYDGRVYALDATGTVSAVSASGGSLVWKASVAPEGQKVDTGGYGGGLAVDGGKLFVTSGFGTVTAFEPVSGKIVWQKNLEVPLRAAPGAIADRVIVITTEGEVKCLSEVDGAEIWSYRGLPQRASLAASSAPAIDGDTIAVPFPSGDLVTIKLSTGQMLWSETLARTTSANGVNPFADAARPLIYGGYVYGVGSGGKMVAMHETTGERLWANNVSSNQPPAIAGDTLWVIDITGSMVAVSRTDGKILWTAKLPAAKVWSGPLIAGGLAWAISDEGRLVGVDAAIGKVATELSLGSKTLIAPVAAQGRMFVLTDKARLIGLN